MSTTPHPPPRRPSGRGVDEIPSTSWWYAESWWYALQQRQHALASFLQVDRGPDRAFNFGKRALNSSAVSHHSFGRFVEGCRAKGCLTSRHDHNPRWGEDFVRGCGDGAPGAVPKGHTAHPQTRGESLDTFGSCRWVGLACSRIFSVRCGPVRCGVRRLACGAQFTPGGEVGFVCCELCAAVDAGRR